MIAKDPTLWPQPVLRVMSALRQKGHLQSPLMLAASAHTAPQAAAALGIELGQIAKSIVFQRQPDARAVLVITSGDLRVDEKKVQALICAPGQKLARANADFVKASTGFSIGGVAPVGHMTAPLILLDCQLLRWDEIWAAAGHPNAVFKLRPLDLPHLTGAELVDIAEQPGA